MEIENYNISKYNNLDSALFVKCHALIDNIEEFVKKYISLRTNNSSYISKSAKIHPTAVLGENIFIDDDVQIGPHCFVKSHSILLKGVKLGFSVEIDRCLLFNNVKIAHNACVGRCIVGKDSNLAYNFVIATKKLQTNEIKSYYDGEIFISNRKHHGAVIGEKFITGVNVSIMPGSTIDHSVTVTNSKTISGYISSQSTI